MHIRHLNNPTFIYTRCATRRCALSHVVFLFSAFHGLSMLQEVFKQVQISVKKQRLLLRSLHLITTLEY